MPGGPPGGGNRTDRWAAAAGCMARQKTLITHLEVAGAAAQAEFARRLLGEMERTLVVMARSRELVAVAA